MIEVLSDQVYDKLNSLRETQPTHGETYGEPLEDDPTADTTRVYVQNLNGLHWDNQGGRWPYICEVLLSMQVDIACFSELNTNTSQYNVRKQMETVCQCQFRQSRLVTSTTSYKTKRTYKPGGTAILACEAITTQIKSHTRDRMGRWMSLAIASSTSTIRIISAYQVCSSNTRGVTTAASQQQAQLIFEQLQMKTGHRRSPRQAFTQDLQAFIMQCQHLNEAIILVGDFNTDISDSSSGMHKLAETCGLVDLFAVRLGESNIPATYQRGTKRIDYALLSPQLIQHIKAAGYEPFGYRIPSDHRGMYIDLSTTGPFNNTISRWLHPLNEISFQKVRALSIITYLQR